MHSRLLFRFKVIDDVELCANRIGRLPFHYSCDMLQRQFPVIDVRKRVSANMREFRISSAVVPEGIDVEVVCADEQSEKHLCVHRRYELLVPVAHRFLFVATIVRNLDVAFMMHEVCKYLSWRARS